MHPANNEQVFEITVHELLQQQGVPVVDQDLRGLLEAIEHGEGNTDSALNLIVQAYVGHLISNVTMPFERDPWTENLLAMKAAVQRGLEKSYRLLSQTTPSVYPVTHSGGWVSFIQECYGLPGWSNLGGDYYNAFFDFEVAVSNLARIGLVEPNVLAEGGEKQGDILATVAGAILDLANAGRPTTWHRFLAAAVVERLIVPTEEVTFENWRTLVDLCHAFIEMSNYAGVGMLLASAGLEGIDDPGVDTTDIKYIEAPPTSKEFWAWEFGRVAVLGTCFDNSKLRDHFDDFQDWPNGVIALGLLLGSGKPVEWAGRWTGVIVACDNPDIEERNPLPVTSNLHWLMQMGVLNAVRQMDKQSYSAEAKEAESAGGQQALLLGSHAELGMAVVEAQEVFEQLRLQKTKEELKQRLPQVWDMLPLDAQEHLVEAELNLTKRKFGDASLDYANSVDAARLEWLERPNKNIRVADTFGDWIRDLREMAGPARSHNYKVQDLKRRFDVGFAKGLAEAFDVLQAARLPRAHGHQRSPQAHKAREVALGSQAPSVFELMLRFAKRWRG